MRWLVALIFFAVTALPVRGAEVPQYNLSAPESQIIVSWLFEPYGYLDAAVNNLGVSARQALVATPSLDIYTWQRANVKGATTVQSDWEEVAMVWWIWKHDQVNVTPPSRPPETALWISRLNEWAASINNALADDPGGTRRNATTSVLTAEDGSTSTMPGGANITHQLTMINKVLGILQ